jgi:signal transduction histidine kinase
MHSLDALLGSPSPDFIALCQAQIDILIGQMGADIGAVYVTEPRSSDLIPIVVYPPCPLRERETRALPTVVGKSDRVPLVKMEDIPTLWAGNERDRLILPLMYEEQMVGLLVTGRERRRWEREELARVDKISRTIAIACLMDRRQQWYEHQLQEERYRRTSEREQLDVFLHQVRNPLTALKTFGKLLLKRLLSDDVNSSAIKGILRESDRLRDLIADFEGSMERDSEQGIEVPLLEGKSSPTAFLLPSIESELENIHLAELLDPLILSATAIARDKGIRLDSDDFAALPTVRANTGGLREVLSNLLDNALKYTPSGGWVQVRARESEDGIAIEVSDTGFGIAAEDRKRIFQRNYRGVQAQGDIPGTGLGLAIAKALLERMGGSIEFISPNPDRDDDRYPGTVFRVYLSCR